MTKDAVIQKAGDVANRVAIHTSNAPEMNKAIDVIAALQKEFGTEKLGKISAQSRIGNGIFSAMGCANGNELTLSGTLLNNPGAAYRRNVSEYKASRQNRIKELEAGIASETKPKVIESLKKSLVKAQEAAKYDRHNVIYEGKEVESVTYHEYGHVLADKLFGQINGSKYLQADEQTAATKRALVEKTFRDAHDDGSIRKISEYGATNSAEFFAEAFTMYKMGVEKLPPAINNMMKEVLKK